MKKIRHLVRKSGPQGQDLPASPRTLHHGASFNASSDELPPTYAVLGKTSSQEDLLKDHPAKDGKAESYWSSRVSPPTPPTQKSKPSRPPHPKYGKGKAPLAPKKSTPLLGVIGSSNTYEEDIPLSMSPPTPPPQKPSSSTLPPEKPTSIPPLGSAFSHQSSGYASKQTNQEDMNQSTLTDLLTPPVPDHPRASKTSDDIVTEIKESFSYLDEPDGVSSSEENDYIIYTSNRDPITRMQEELSGVLSKKGPAKPTPPAALPVSPHTKPSLQSQESLEAARYEGKDQLSPLAPKKLPPGEPSSAFGNQNALFLY